MFRRYSLFDNNSPRLSSVLPTDNETAQRKNSLEPLPENQQMLPSKHIALILQQQRKTRSLSNSPVYRKKKYANLPKLIDHYYDYDENGVVQPQTAGSFVKNSSNIARADQQQRKNSAPSSSVVVSSGQQQPNIRNDTDKDEDDCVIDDNTDGIRYSHHVSRREKTRRNSNLHSFGNSIGLTPHKRLINDDVSGGGGGGSGVQSLVSSRDASPRKPLQSLVFSAADKSPQRRRNSSPVHSCMLVRRRSEFYDPSFASCPPLLPSLKVSDLLTAFGVVVLNNVVKSSMTRRAFVCRSLV